MNQSLGMCWIDIAYIGSTQHVDFLPNQEDIYRQGCVQLFDTRLHFHMGCMVSCRDPDIARQDRPRRMDILSQSGSQ